ncbi:MAG: hypothetical protein WD845_00960 [Pirellulales bacterium]
MVAQLAALECLATVWSDETVLAAEQAAEPLLMRLDPPRRVQVIMALLGLLLVAGLLVALVVMGGRRARRIARLRPQPSRLAREAWYRKPLAPPSTSDPASREPE